jgi:signal transduction histidine kinase
VHPDDWHLTSKLLPQLLAGSILLYTVERRYLRGDGSVFWGRADVSLVRDAAGQPSYVIGAMVDISERKQAEEVLARSRDELERLVRERTAKLQETIGDLEHFSYCITHDMRAPLRAMQGYASLLEQECAGCTRAQGLEFFRRIRVASDRMDQLIQDSLNYAKIVREELPLRPVDLAKLLHGIIESYPNLHVDKAEIRIEGELPVVLGNEAGLTHCFSNLLGNAVKFVAPGVKPRVRVWAEVKVVNERISESVSEKTDAEPSLTHSLTDSLTGSRVRIWVEDNGIGIPKQARESIFGMFQRLHRDNEYPGTGIGLTIVRKAVQRMGGQVGVESEVGKGSKFWIQLPKADS